MFQFRCPCGRILQVEDWQGGQKAACPQCGNMLVPTPTQGGLLGSGAQSTALDPEFGKRARTALQRDLESEGDARAVAVWFLLFGVFGFVVGGIGATSTTVVAAQDPRPVAVAGTLGLLLLALGIAEVSVGAFLWSYHAWARWGAVGAYGAQIVVTLLRGSSRGTGGLTIAVILCFYHGTVLWFLCQARSGAIFSEQYRRLVSLAPPGNPRWWRSAYFTAPAVLAAVALGLAWFMGLSP